MDFNPDLNYDFESDWDIGYPPPSGKSLQGIRNWRSSNGGLDLRIHAALNFEDPYPVREANKITADNPEDALYVRIESEPIVQLPFVKNQASKHTVFSTVRQIFININQSNMDAQYRPLVIFYDGPEAYDPDSHIRDSQPVVLTLNEDARVILFAPNSPVVIRGNNKTLQGFVIAKEFVQLTTASDYTNNNGRYFDDDGKEYFYIEEEGTFVDKSGNVQTKPLESDSTRSPNYDDQNGELLEKPVEDGITRQNKDYELVYKREAFNLSTNSFYDSFKIESLKRTIYTYLDNYMSNETANSVDMFFTKYRASWID